MTKRPYLNYGTDTLESLFNDAKNDGHVLKALSYELRHRDRSKAKILQSKVNLELKRLNSASGQMASGGAATPSIWISPDPVVRDRQPDPVVRDLYLRERYSGPEAHDRKPESSPSRETTEPTTHTPVRISVECAHCSASNFVSTLDGVVQHLSCSSCRTSYEAVFKYGVMRTRFDETKPRSAWSSPIGYILIAVVVLLALAVVLK